MDNGSMKSKLVLLLIGSASNQTARQTRIDVPKVIQFV